MTDHPLIRDMMNHALNGRTGSSGLFSSFQDTDLTDEENSTGNIPTNYSYPVYDVRRQGAAGDGTTDDAAAIQKSYDVAAVNGATVIFPPDRVFRCTTNINVHVGSGSSVDTVGPGWACGGVLFDGAGVTTGFTQTGSGWSYAGGFRNLRIRGTNGAVRGWTGTDLNMPRIERCFISGFAGAGAAFYGTLMGKLSHTLLTSCGSATEGSVEVDRTGSIQSTTFSWDHSYISGGNTAVGGLVIGRTPNVTILGGAIESSGIPIRIAHRSDSAVGCVGGIIHSIDMENPGNSNPYIEMGAGLSSVFVTSWDVRGSAGYPSSSTPTTYAVRLYRTNGCRFGPNNWAQAGSPTSTYELESTGNLGLVIEPHRNLFGNTFPWVRVNGSFVKAAGPQTEWLGGDVPVGKSAFDTLLADTTTPSILVSDTQGGFYRSAAFASAAPITVTNLNNGELGMEITLRATNANTTLQHSAAGTDTFTLTAGANLAMVSQRPYIFIRNGSRWAQIAT